MDLVKEILALFEANRNDHDAVFMKAYMKGHFEYFGIKSAPRRQLLSDVFHKNLIKSPDELFQICRALWQAPHREAQYAAMDILDKYKTWMKPETLPYIESLILEKSWWDTVDHLAAHQTGLCMKNMHRDQKRATMEKFIDSGELWLQRTAIIYQLSYKDQTDQELLEYAILATLEEKNFFIRKAHGWALRHYSRTDKKWVSEFLLQYREQLSPLAIREASKYI